MVLLRTHHQALHVLHPGLLVLNFYLQYWPVLPHSSIRSLREWLFLAKGPLGLQAWKQNKLIKFGRWTIKRKIWVCRKANFLLLTHTHTPHFLYPKHTKLTKVTCTKHGQVSLLWKTYILINCLEYIGLGYAVYVLCILKIQSRIAYYLV